MQTDASTKTWAAPTVLGWIRRLLRLRRLGNIARFGMGEGARERKRIARDAARGAAFESEAWRRDKDVAQRAYASYDDYLKHQASKLGQIEERLHETYEADFAEFRRRFADCEPLREARNVLCLAARIGTEVRALHALGYFAVGIDLNPGADNPCVLKGDFHHLVFPDGVIDAIYCNSLDHAMDLDKLLSEIKRVLRARGLFIADLLQGYDEGFTPGAFESMSWRNRQEFIERIAELGGFEVVSIQEMGLHRRDEWTQVVFRKGSEGSSPDTTE